MRRAAKVDGNHRTIVAAFKALGCTVQSLAAVGKGVPDLLVAFAGLNHLVEIKDGRKAKSGRKFTPAQVAWASTWRAPRHLVESMVDVQRLVKAWANQHHRNTWRINDVVAGRVAPSDVEVDASDYERPHKPGEWLPMPHKDSPRGCECTEYGFCEVCMERDR
jgi:hypothetical protein